MPPNQKRTWSDPLVRLDRLPAAEAFLGRHMEMDDGQDETKAPVVDERQDDEEEAA